ncbi:MAG: radical SAM family heme chaperone HemW [Actinobacteria bacterium]|nr:radical SAM family heme chaperone HemW [Actinomycetota bacterium]
MRIYIHWPFCVSRCSYCDFNSRVASRRTRHAYMRALLRELEAWACMLNGEDRWLDSIYLGGGTPSVLSGSELSSLLEEVGSRFYLHDSTEVTAEVNPATWDRGDYAAARAGGVNRISIGVQSLSDRQLSLLGRAHDAAAARMAMRHALGCGAASVSVDLLYGLPGMDAETLLECLNEVLAMGVHHLSMYALTLAGSTRLAHAVASGEITLPDEEEVAEQYLAASGMLRARGYEHYEISNFSLPGHHGRHNLAYWEREEYLGIGAGAHSLLGKYRFHNLESILAYARALAKGELAVAACEVLAEKEELAEEIMLGLRTSRGIELAGLVSKDSELYEMEKEGFMARDGGRVRLTERGMLVSNALIVRLMPA